MNHGLSDTREFLHRRASACSNFSESSRSLHLSGGRSFVWSHPAYHQAAQRIQRFFRWWRANVLHTRLRLARQRDRRLLRKEWAQLQLWSVVRLQAWVRGRLAVSDLRQHFDAVEL